jgi:hypothetical protein
MFIISRLLQATRASAPRPEQNRPQSTPLTSKNVAGLSSGAVVDEPLGLSEHTLQNKQVSIRCDASISRQDSFYDLPSRVAKPPLAKATRSSAVRLACTVMPHLPDEIGVAVFSEVGPKLNPMTLMTLMNVRQKDTIPLFLTRVAWDDRYWRPFSPAGAEPAKSCAHAFVERWDLMSAQHRRILEKLWTGRARGLDTLQDHVDVRKSFDIALAAVCQNGEAIRFVAAELTGERAIILAAVKQNGRALFYAHDRLKRDPGIVMAAVSQNGRALQYAATELQGELGVVMAAINQCAAALAYASAELRRCKNVVMAAVSRHGWALEFASADLQAERDVAMAAVSQEGAALKFVAAHLRDDRDLVMAAVCQEGWALQYASVRLRDHLDIVIAAVSQEGRALQFASDRAQFDRDVVMAAVRQDAWTLLYVAGALRVDRDVVLTAVGQDGELLRYAGALRADRQVVISAVFQNGQAFKFAARSLQNDPQLLALAQRTK